MLSEHRSLTALGLDKENADIYKNEDHSTLMLQKFMQILKDEDPAHLGDIEIAAASALGGDEDTSFPHNC